MKKLIPFIIFILIVAVIVIIFVSMANKKQMTTILKDNHTHKAVDIKANHFQDTVCAMTITTKENSAQAVAPDGRTWFFDDIGCLVTWYEQTSFKENATIWVYSHDTNKYIDGRKAWFNRTQKTPMGYGFGAYEKKQEGMITFEEVILKVLRDEHLMNPYIRQELLGK